MLFAHISGVLILTAGVGASIACKIMATKTTSPSTALTLLTTASVSVRYCSTPGSFLLIITGVGLVHATNGAYPLSSPWIAYAVAMWIASAFVGIFMHAPRSKAVRKLASELIDKNSDVTDELRTMIRKGTPASLIDTALLIGMVAVMIFKPGQ